MRRKKETPFQRAEREGIQRGGGPVHISVPLVKVLERLHRKAPDGEPKKLMAEALDGAKKRALKDVN
ncbi:hypothetical protein J4450_07150 [Candidatus Micrarchaeota archaeon]|nr:hypothetical protein [Candidatus Micrarchaeota archaeon]